MNMNSDKKVLMELSAERDFSFSVPVRSRYAVICSPRSGSTLLCRGLSRSQVAGDPLEYLSDYLLHFGRLRYADPQMGRADFLRKMEGIRTSLNGVFGIQIHYSQLLNAFRGADDRKNIDTFLKRFDRFIFVRRRDKLAQAASYAIAKKTRKWSSEDESELNPGAHEFSDRELLGALNMVAAHDLGWITMARDLSIECKTVWYEDLAEDFSDGVCSTLNYIGVAPNALCSPEAPIAKQSTQLNLELRERLARYLGVSCTT